MTYLQSETINLDVKEQVGFLFKAALGFPTTKETTPFFMETAVPPNNYIFSSDIATDTVPSEVFSGTSKDVTTIGLTTSDFCAGGGIKENADGTVREYTFLILDEIPNSSQQGWYKKNSEGENQLADALQFNTNAGAANWYTYNMYSETNITASGNITSPNGGNWMFDVKNGVIFVPDSTSAFNNTNNKPVLSFYKYIGNKGISGGGGGGGGGAFSVTGSDAHYTTGNVGIGTTTPSCPLHVKNSSTLGMSGFYYIWGTQPVYRYDNYTSYPNAAKIGLETEWSINCGQFLNFSSDERIKCDISSVQGDTALNIVNSLDTKEYNYIDPQRKREHKTIGFIAQEVKEVIPNAVNIQTDYVPDELRVIENPSFSQFTDESGNNKFKLEINDLDFSGNFTGKCKFYVSNDLSGNDEVCKEVNVETDAKTFVFDESWNNVLLYGKEVTDFHTLDKNQIFALHHSGIQELSRKNDALTQEVATLKTENADYKARLEALEAAFILFQQGQ